MFCSWLICFLTLRPWASATWRDFVVLLEFVCCAIDGQTMYFLVTGASKSLLNDGECKPRRSMYLGKL